MRILLTALAAMFFAASSAAAPSQPTSFQVDVDRFGRWNGEIQSLLDWDDEEPFLEAAICELQNGPITIRFRRGGIRGRRSYPDVWIDQEAIAEQRKHEQVEISGLTIGSRSFQRARSDWQVAGWFSNFG